MDRRTGLSQHGPDLFYSDGSWPPPHKVFSPPSVAGPQPPRRSLPTLCSPCLPSAWTSHFNESFLCRQALEEGSSPSWTDEGSQEATWQEHAAANRSLGVSFLDPSSLGPVWLYPKVPHWKGGEVRASCQLLRDAPSSECLGPWCGNFRDLSGPPTQTPKLRVWRC